MIDFTNDTNGGGSTASSSINTLFSVNSGNVNSSGEGDLVDEASYNTTTQDNFYLYSKDNPTSRTDGVFTAGYNGTYFEPNPSTFDFATLFSSTNWRITTKVKSNRDVWLRFQKGTSTSGAVGSWNVGWYYTTTTYSNRYEIYPSSGSVQMTNFTGTTVNFSTQFAYLSVMLDNSTIYIQQSLDNSTWETLASFAVTDIQKEYNAFHWEMGRDALFDMKETYVSINGQIVWTGYENINILDSLSFKIGDTYPSITATNGQNQHFTVNEVEALDLSQATDGNYTAYITPEGEIYANKGTVYVQPDEPTMTTDDVWLNTSVYPYKAVQSDGTTEFADVPIATFTIATQSNGSVLLINPKTLEYNRLSNNLIFISGYDPSATQVLKNVAGVLTWVTEGV